MIRHALVLRTLPSDAVLVLDQYAVGGEVELIPDGLEGHADPLILKKEPGTILPEFALSSIRVDGLSVVEVHVERGGHWPAKRSRDEYGRGPCGVSDVSDEFT